MKLVSARELHEFLEVKTQFKDWFPRMCEYGFIQDIDFSSLKIEQVQNEGNRQVKRTITDYVIAITMAKELSMIQRTEKGREARRYFIACEEKLKEVSQVKLPSYSDALRQLADNIEKMIG